MANLTLYIIRYYRGHCHNCHFRFRSYFFYPGLDFLCTTRRVFLEKKTGHLPYRCTSSNVLVESELLIWSCYFVCMILVNLCSLLCASVIPVMSSLSLLIVIWFPYETRFPWLLVQQYIKKIHENLLLAEYRILLKKLFYVIKYVLTPVFCQQ